MPAYDYTCDSNHIWEEQRLMKDRDLPSVCPTCGVEGKRVFITAPHVMWFPSQTRSGFKEKRKTS